MKLYEAALFLKQQLLSIYDEGEAGNIVALALEDITGYNHAQRITNKEEELIAPKHELLKQYAERLRRHEPIQYVLNRSWFYGMELYVDKNVLIPRPETEELVEWVINDQKAEGKDVFEKVPMKADETTTLKILDVGTGSGCIALALKKEMPRAEIWGCDHSDEALSVARRNGSSLNIRVDFQGMNFLDHAQQKQLPSVDVVVSNPPYIPAKDREQMSPNVLNYEPHAALFVPDNDALVFYRALANFGKHRLHPNGCIYMEIHEDLGSHVTTLFKNEGYELVEIRKDMQGKERMIKARK